MIGRSWIDGFKDYIEANKDNQYTVPVEQEDYLILFKSDAATDTYDRITTIAELAGGMNNLPFDGERVVTRQGIPNINPHASTVREFLENYFYPFIEATISINSTSIYQIGTDNIVTIEGDITLHNETAMINGRVDRILPTAATIHTFDSDLHYTTDIVFNPRQTPGGIEQAHLHTYQAYSEGVTNGTIISSSTKTVKAIYPYLYGVSSIDFTVTSGAYTGLIVDVADYGNKTYPLTGSGYIYICYPDSYPDLISIKDHNGFEQINAFSKTLVTISSSGLAVNWSISYKIYKLNNITAPTGWNYTFRY